MREKGKKRGGILRPEEGCRGSQQMPFMLFGVVKSVNFDISPAWIKSLP